MKITFFYSFPNKLFFRRKVLLFTSFCLEELSYNETLDTKLHTSWRLPKQFYQADPEMYKKALKIKFYLAWCFQDRKKENAPKFSSMEKWYQNCDAT